MLDQAAFLTSGKETHLPAQDRESYDTLSPAPSLDDWFARSVGQTTIYTVLYCCQYIKQRCLKGSLQEQWFTALGINVSNSTEYRHNNMTGCLFSSFKFAGYIEQRNIKNVQTKVDLRMCVLTPTVSILKWLEKRRRKSHN